MADQTHWTASATLPAFPPLDRDLSVDAVVIGAGMTGITTAYLLHRAGLSVALVERDRCAMADTAHTTAHLTFVTDLRASDLLRTVGRDHAQAVWDAGAASMLLIHEIATREEIDCRFRWVPAYLHAPRDRQTTTEFEHLQQDADAARQFGFDATYLDSVPFLKTPGIRFPNQAKFHPLKYLAGLLERMRNHTIHVFENSEVTEVQDDNTVIVNGRRLRCRFVVIATHIPLQGKVHTLAAALFQSKLTPYTSYVLGATAKPGTVPEAHFWDTSDPYFYLRVDPGTEADYLIYGGLDHRTGQEDNTEQRYLDLDNALHALVPSAHVRRRWSGQVIATHDELPYIGEIAPGQFIATGFNGNGITFGTIAALMACDYALGGKDPWTDLFNPKRAALTGAWDYLKDNLAYPYYMIKDRIARSETDLDTLKPRDGRVMKIDGKRVAAYRDPDGRLITCSPYCTHLGCLVHWNEAESTWDCPCHGSRFRPTGEVLAGPAESNLEPA